MGCCCQCLVNVAGYSAIVYAAYKLLTAIWNVVGVYLFSSPIDLKKKAGADWAVVTGATDGIGKAYAFDLARRGFNILLVSRTQSKLDDTKKEISEAHSSVQIKTFAFNFSAGSAKDYEPLVAQLKEIEVGVLINNVGRSYEYPDVLHNVAGGLELVGDITVINTLPPTVLSAAVLPQMVARKSGVIVNISSSANYNEMELWAVYSATKKYVNWLTGIMRKEYAGQGIEIQTICPMLVATKMSKIKRTGVFSPNGEQFAKSALNTIGHADETTGYLYHQIQVEAMNMVPQFLLDIFLSKMSKGMRAAALRKIERETKAQ